MKRITFGAIMLLLMAGCDKDKVEVTYKVDCGSCRVTYLDKNYKTIIKELYRPKVSGWKVEFDAEPGQNLYISAHHFNTGQISVQIYINGELVMEDTDGAFTGHHEFVETSMTVP